MRKSKQKISSFNPLIEESKEVLLPIVPQPKKKVAKEKFKISGHLIDQKLKAPDSKSNRQLSIFEIIETDTVKEVVKTAIEKGSIKDSISIGLDLTATEDKLIYSLSKILYKKSNTTDFDRNYYSGNEAIEKSSKGKIIPKLLVTGYELTKEYSNKDNPSGKDIENVKKVLSDLNGKEFIIKYQRESKDSKGNRVVETLEGLEPVINIKDYKKETFDKDTDKKLFTESDMIIELNPLFKDQIETKFVLYPMDYRERLEASHGNPKVPIVTSKLADYLLREIASKRYSPEISYSNLVNLLDEKNSWRKQDMRGWIDKAVATLKDMEIIKEVEEGTNIQGEKKLIFSLNKEWE